MFNASRKACTLLSLTYEAENVTLLPAGVVAFIEEFVQYSSSKEWPKISTSSPSFHTAGGNALALPINNKLMTTLTAAANIRFK